MQLAKKIFEVAEMKAGLNKDIILKATAEIADEQGVASITLKALAEKLGVKSPSLYKHISGLEELNKELMLYGWRSLGKEVAKSAIGKAKDDAIKAIFYAYRSYVKQHPGVFEAMQWYNMYLTEENLQATEGLVEILFQVLSGYGLEEQQKVHIGRMFRGFLQGFMSVECHGGYGNPLPVQDSFDFALEIMLNGIHKLQGGKN